MKRAIAFVFLLSAKLTFGQIINDSFEVWDTTYTGNYSSYLSSIYGVPNPYAGKVNHWNDSSPFGISQTTDSYSGNYSLILHNWYNYAREWITYYDSISTRPLFLQGYFKYIKGGTHSFAQGEAKVTLTRFNGASNDTIATGSYLFDTTASFIHFQLTLNYISALVPDSISIYIINSNNVSNYSTTVVVSNLLYLDDLTLSNIPLNITNINSAEDLVTVYPNPVIKEVTLSFNRATRYNVQICNIFGEVLFDTTTSSEEMKIDVTDFQEGIYFVAVKYEKNNLVVRKIVKM